MLQHDCAITTHCLVLLRSFKPADMFRLASPEGKGCPSSAPPKPRIGSYFGVTQLHELCHLSIELYSSSASNPDRYLSAHGISQEVYYGFWILMLRHQGRVPGPRWNICPNYMYHPAIINRYDEHIFTKLAPLFYKSLPRGRAGPAHL